MFLQAKSDGDPSCRTLSTYQSSREFKDLVSSCFNDFSDTDAVDVQAQIRLWRSHFMDPDFCRPNGEGKKLLDLYREFVVKTRDMELPCQIKSAAVYTRLKSQGKTFEAVSLSVTCIGNH